MKTKLEAIKKLDRTLHDSEHSSYLAHYGYLPDEESFYADQLSTDPEPMGGFNMHKSGVIWPVPEVVEGGAYSGSAGWGGTKAKIKKMEVDEGKLTAVSFE